jgi:hypothetical protein
VTAVQVAPGEIGVTVTLTQAGAQFHDTGDPEHHALAFDLTGSPSITIANLPSPFTADGVQTAGSVGGDGAGSFEYEIEDPHVSGPPAGITSFSFDILGTGLTVSDFIPNGNGNYFATDIVGANGKTGNVGANTFSATPEPATWAVMMIGFGAIGAMIRRSRRRASLA